MSAIQPANVYEAGEVSRSETPGRPSSYLNAGNVIFLFQNGFKFSHIADMNLVHRTTLWKRRSNSGIHLNKYTNISDDELMAVMKNIQQNPSHSGVTMMAGHLRSNRSVVK